MCEENKAPAPETLEPELENAPDEAAARAEDYLEKLQRVMAEFDNFRKRAQKESESRRSEAIADTICEFLPVLDNLERAVESIEDKATSDGIKLIIKQFTDTMGKFHAEEIPALGEQFNPELHNAVMHIEDEAVDDNTIVEQFQKGYRMKERVIRYSMVKVAN